MSPVRGRPERPHFSAPEDLTAHGLDEGREAVVGLQLVAASVPYVEVGLDLTAVLRSSEGIGLDLVVVDRHVGTIGLDLFAIGAAPPTNDVDAVRLGLVARAPCGYASAPRLVTKDSLVVGQERQRRGVAIPD